MDHLLRIFLTCKGLCVEPSFGNMLASQPVIEAVLGELRSVGKRGGLKSAEIIQNVVLVSEEWTPENVTPLIVGIVSRRADDRICLPRRGS